MRNSRCAPASLFVLLAPLCLEAQPPAEEILAKPLSPGAVALLALHPRDPAVLLRVEEALAHESATVRAAAARVVRATGLAALAPLVAEALRGEEDAGAAEEEMFAVASMTREDASILDAAERLGLANEAGAALAAGRGARALAHLERLRELDPDFRLLEFSRLATRGLMESLTARVPEAFRENDAALWTAYLEIAREREHAIDRDHLLDALSVPALRDDTLWHLVLADEIDPALLDDVRETLETSGGEASVETRFLLELRSRKDGGVMRDDDAWIDARRAREPTKVQSTSPGALLLLTENERRALSEQEHGDDRALDEAHEWAREREQRVFPDPSDVRAASSFQTVSGYPDGMVADLIEVTECRPRELVAIGSATIHFTEDGRPRSIVLDAPVRGEKCDTLSRTLLATSVLPPRALTEESQSVVLLVPIEPDFLSCLSEPAPGQDFPGPSLRIEPPKKRRDQRPVYPGSARAERVEGVVILEASIQPSGCVRSLRALHNPDDRLTAAAILAASKWRYEAAEIDGEPVPMRMTVSVNFSLR